MSIFDVIKYPISTPPTLEELAALPDTLFYKWVRSSFVSLKGRTEAYNYFQLSVASEEPITSFYSPQNKLEKLRKLIEEYDESI